MTLLEEISSGKYNLILFGILFIFMFHQYWSKNTEPMADVGNLDQIKEAVKQVYMADVESIRNLSNVATQLQAGGLTIPGDLTVKGKLKTSGELNVESGKVLMGTVGANMWGINVNQTDDGTFSLGRVGRDGKPNNKIGLQITSSADGSQYTGCAFSLIPPGTIVAWTGDKAPVGWVLCDGANKTPDLRGRFIIGTGKGDKLSDRKLNDIGGTETVDLTIDNIPPHTHDYDKTGRSTANEAHKDGSRDLVKSINSTSTNTSKVGGGKPHENMPPFYALAYIMKL